MFTAISTALSGLNADSIAIDVVGNNLANLNTTGYKDNSVSFQDLMSESIYGSAQTQVGLGTTQPFTFAQFNQGSIQTTSGALDAAIQGDGFFVVKDANNQTLLTRAGNLQVDPSGNLVTEDGDAVEGWAATNGVVNSAGALTGLTIPTGSTLPPKATTTFSVDANLDAGAQAGTTQGTFSSEIQGIDSLGNTVPLTVTFSKGAAPGQWSYQVSVPGSTVGSTSSSVDLLATPGTLAFDASGALTTPTAAAGNIPLTVTGLADGAADMNLNWSLFSPDGTPRLTQFSEASAISANSQDGQPPAQLTKVSLGNDGQVIAQYSNGIQQIAGQLAVANVVNPQSLASVGNNNYALTSASSALTIGTAGTGGRGQILGQSLEESTVDIASEFSNLLVYQRSYQANSRVVTASDEVVLDTMNLIK